MTRHTRVVRVDDTLGFLLGEWSLERHLHDRLSGERAVFTGTASVTRLRGPEGSASYEERGRLRCGAHDGEATRVLELARRGAAVLARFADGRPFVEIDLRTGRAACVHLCGGDRYELSFAVLAPDELEERWRVEGPETAYVARTVLRRRPPA